MRPVSWLPGLPAAIALMALLPSAATAGGGTVAGRFMLAGEVPAAPALIRKGDASVRDSCVCAAETMLRNDLVIDKATKGIRHIFVYLQRAPAQHQMQEARKMPLPEVAVRVKHCRYEPHTLIARTGQTIRVKSEDAIPHSPNVIWNRNRPFGRLLETDISEVFAPELAERVPIPVKCDLHAWMKSYWLILDHPYATITPADGTFRIRNLPAGTHHFIAWHERVGYVNAGERRGFEVTVEDGETADIGTIKLPLSLFQQD